jgi:phage-related protein
MAEIEVKLRECPFCGGEARVRTFCGKYRVSCDNPDCVIRPNTPQRIGTSPVITAWNTRSTSQRIAQLEEALASVTRELDEMINVTSRAINQCNGNFLGRVELSIKAIAAARAAMKEEEWEMNKDRIGNEVYSLTQSMVLFGVTLEEAISELRLAYAEELESIAKQARKDAAEAKG